MRAAGRGRGKSKGEAPGAVCSGHSRVAGVASKGVC